MRHRYLLLAPVLLPVLAAGLLLTAGKEEPKDRPIPDTEIGLIRAGIHDAPAPAKTSPIAAGPGETGTLPRPYYISPPRIPHATADFLPITRDGNACIDCHFIEEAGEGDPVPIPASHFIDYRNAPGKKQPAPVGARHVCLACHVTRTDAPALPGSVPPPVAGN